MRASVIENGRVTRLLYFNGELLTESDQDETVTNRYLLGYGVAAGCQNGNEGYHSYHLDEQNSTAYITDSGQRIENSYQYDSFGGIRSNNEKVHNRILYTGQQYDQVTGQYYLRARYYNPVVGRFLQEDVYRGDGLNLYAYCHNNPVVYYDPSGYVSQKDLATIVLGMTYDEKVDALYTRRNEYVQEKIDSGKLVVSYATLKTNELEVGSYITAPKTVGDGVTPHHMPSASSISADGIDYNDGSCLNVMGKTHTGTFTYGLSENGRPYDNALYESLTYEDRLEFDRADIQDIYSRTRPNVPEDILKEKLHEQYDLAMRTKKDSDAKNEISDDGKC